MPASDESDASICDEQRLLRLIASGCAGTEVAALLGVPLIAVAETLVRIRRELGVTSTAAAIRAIEVIDAQAPEGEETPE